MTHRPPPAPDTGQRYRAATEQREADDATTARDLAVPLIEEGRATAGDQHAVRLGDATAAVRLYPAARAHSQRAGMRRPLRPELLREAAGALDRVAYETRCRGRAPHAGRP